MAWKCREDGRRKESKVNRHVDGKINQDVLGRHLTMKTINTQIGTIWLAQGVCGRTELCGCLSSLPTPAEKRGYSWLRR